MVKVTKFDHAFTNSGFLLHHNIMHFEGIPCSKLQNIYEKRNTGMIEFCNNEISKINMNITHVLVAQRMKHNLIPTDTKLPKPFKFFCISHGELVIFNKIRSTSTNVSNGIE